MSLDFNITRHPVNTAVDDIIKWLRLVKDLDDNVLNKLVVRGLTFSEMMENPSRDEIPAIYVHYRQTPAGKPSVTHDKAAAHMIIGNWLAEVSLFFVLYDYRDEGTEDRGVQDKLIDLVRYNLMQLQKAEGFEPPQGKWRWWTGQHQIPVRMVNQLEGISRVLITPPYYVARADLAIVVEEDR